MRLVSGFIITLFLFPLVPSASQQAPVAMGQRVRVSFRCSTPPCRQTGTLAGWQNDTLSLSTGGATQHFSRFTLTQLELSRGRKSHWLAGAGIGFVAGTGTVVLLLTSGTSTSICDSAHNQDAIGPIGCLGIASVTGGLPLGLVGALVGGLLVKTERWETADTRGLRVGVLPRRGGVGFGASLRF